MITAMSLLSLKMCNHIIQNAIYISLIGDGLEGAEAGSRQAAMGAAVQSAAAHLTMQLGSALLYALLHGILHIYM